MLKKIINTCLLTSVALFLSLQNNSFKTSQLKNSRVKTAYEKKWPSLQTLLTSKKIQKDLSGLYIRVFKKEELLEVWAKSGSERSYKLLKTFPICASSGILGPKRRQGDEQVPEGFYEIVSFQPQSSYHLALKVGYPNKSDRIKAEAKDPGGDIMIHGNCVTIGCIPIQNDPIEELYVLSVEAKNHGCTIFTDIYPFKFNEKNMGLIKTNSNVDLQRFWNSLKPAYDHFEQTNTLAKITINKKGDYSINSN
jgi:murein L,D-transpeptidase YafK